MSSGADPVTGDAARHAAQAELSKAQYHRDDPSITARVLDWLLDRVGSVLSRAADGTVADVLIVIITVAAVIATVLAVRRAGPFARVSAPAPTHTLGPVGQQDHRTAAERYSADGEWALALREWLRDCAATVERRGLLNPRPGRTATELARSAGQRLPTAAAALDRAGSAFEQIWFGNRAATAADAETGREASGAVRSAATRPADPVQPSYVVPS